jgi:sortase A
MHHRSHTRDFILIPVVYFLLGYFVLFLLVFPFRHSISSAVNLLFFNKPNMTEEPVGNIFSTAPEISSGTINLSSIKFPTYGARFGKVKLPSAGIDADLYFGDGTDQLKNGVGVYNGSSIPGYGQTILIAGHNHTFFHTLGKAKQGDKIQIDTNYGKYIYQVKKTQIRNASDTSAYDLRSKKENLILYTCYPFNELGLTAQRYYVYADMVSGPKIDKQE